MDREYEIFEIVEGAPMWRGHGTGLLDARRHLLQLSRQTTNECFAIHLESKEIIGRLNVCLKDGVKPLVVQVCFDQALAKSRTEALRDHGYEVIAVSGSEAAKAVLAPGHHCDLFVIDDAPSRETRINMVIWLKSNYAGVPVVALNPPNGAALAGADFNVMLDGSQSWLPAIARALGRETRRTGI